MSGSCESYIHTAEFMFGVLFLAARIWLDGPLPGGVFEECPNVPSGNPSCWGAGLFSLRLQPAIQSGVCECDKHMVKGDLRICLLHRVHLQHSMMYIIIIYAHLCKLLHFN